MLEDGMCDITCPGDTRLFCGGFRSSLLPRRDNFGLGLNRRAAPPDILLTVYESADVPEPSNGGTGGTSLPTRTDGTSSTRSTSSTTNGQTGVGSATDTPGAGDGSSLPSFTDGRSSYLTTRGSEPVTTLITVLYTVVDPRNPSNLITAEYCTTMEYYPCRGCPDKGVPTVDMIVTEASCHACGPDKGDTVMLTVPAIIPAETEVPVDRYSLTKPGSIGQAQPTRLGGSQDSPNRESPGQASRPHQGGSDPLSASTRAGETFQASPTTGATPLATARPEIVLATGVQTSMGWTFLGLASLATALLFVI